MPPSQQRSRVVASTSSRIVTTTTQRRVIARRRASAGAKVYREATLLTEDDEDDVEEGGRGSTPKPTPALNEAREQSKNNLRQAWDAIFTRYSKGDHLAAGKDDVVDFGTGEIVEDAGFLDDFIVEDEDQPFAGRSIEIGDFGLPGAIGMGDVTDSSGGEEEEAAIMSISNSRRGSVKSEASDSDVASGDDLLLESSPTRRIRRRAVARTHTKDSRGRISRSVSMPESIDLLSSSSSSEDDLLWQRDVQPVSDRYKEIKRVKTSIQEDLKDFIAAENARQDKEAAERVKRERTCTPFLSSPSKAHMRAGSSRPMPRSAPTSYRQNVSSSLARSGSVTPSQVRSQQRFPTPSTSSSHISVKPESSSSSLDIKPFRAVSLRPQGRSFSVKPSSSSSTPQSSSSAIPLGHYSNTLHYQAFACDDESSDDDMAMRTSRTRVKKEERSASTVPWSLKGKERAKEEDIEPDNVFLDNSTTHLPSPPPSRRKRSPTFFASPTAPTLRLAAPRPQAMRPVVEIIRSASRTPQQSRPAQQTQKHPPHTIPRIPPSKLESYRPKQSSPLKGSSNQLHRSRQLYEDMTLPLAPIYLSSDSSDEDDDIPLRSLPSQASSKHAQQVSPSSSAQRAGREPLPTRQAYTSPNKRKYPTSPESPESPTSRARTIPSTSPRRFSSTRHADRQSPVTPSSSLAKMSLASSQRSSAMIRRPKEETPDVTIAIAQTIRRADSIRPAPSNMVHHISHLPTPPLSSGSATSFSDSKEETPDIKEEEECNFKIPPTPKRPKVYTPSRAAAKSSVSPRARNSPANRYARNNGQKVASSDEESDDIRFVSPSRPKNMPKQRQAPASPDSGVVRSVSRVPPASVVHETKLRRTSIVAGTSPKASPTVTRARPPAGSDGDESDDPLGI